MKISVAYQLRELDRLCQSTHLVLLFSEVAARDSSCRIRLTIQAIVNKVAKEDLSLVRKFSRC